MTQMIVQNTVSAATGRWPQLLPALGINVASNGHHSACPVCGGKDRFRFDNQAGRGTWICNNCGAGDGLNLVAKTLDITTKEAAVKVAEILGEVQPLPVHHDNAAIQQQKDDARQKAAEQAKVLMNTALTAAGNAYLEKKGWADKEALTLQGDGLRVGGIEFTAGDLVIPLYDLSDNLVNAQLINGSGEKRMLAGGQVTGAAYHFEGNGSTVIWMAEGYATGLTIHALTGETVYVALSANNFPHLAKCLREKYPDAVLLMAADNDENGTGQKKAKEAANLVSGKVALPLIAGDWNDVFMQEGRDNTVEQLSAFTQQSPKSPFETISDADLKAMSQSEKCELLIVHYEHRLAIPPVGEDLCRYEEGAWQILPHRILSREIAALFQKAQAPFSAPLISGMIETLKLMVPEMGKPARHLIGFRNGVFNTLTGRFNPHRKDNWLRTVNSVDYSKANPGENLAEHAPHFWQWLTRAANRQSEKQERILAALFMVLANRYDWQLFLEVTGPGGSGKSIMAEIATMLAGKDNTTSATIETLESSRERAAVIGYSLIILPDQEKWSGDGAGIKAITGGDAVSVDPKYRDAYSTHIPAVILAVNNNPMRFTDRSGGVSRRRVILHFPEQIAPEERDPQLRDKISLELAIIVRQLMQQFSQPATARNLLQAQQNSDEAISIKRDADPVFDFCGYLEALVQPSGMYMGNANIVPRQPRNYLYHAYLAYMEANGYKNVLSLKMFGLGLPMMLKEYGVNYEKRHTRQGTQTNITLTEESNSDWLPKCDDTLSI